jgi:hypothetical protein
MLYTAVVIPIVALSGKIVHFGRQFGRHIGKLSGQAIEREASNN